MDGCQDGKFIHLLYKLAVDVLNYPVQLITALLLAVPNLCNYLQAVRISAGVVTVTVISCSPLYTSDAGTTQGNPLHMAHLYIRARVITSPTHFFYNTSSTCNSTG